MKIKFFAEFSCFWPFQVVDVAVVDVAVVDVAVLFTIL